MNFEEFNLNFRLKNKVNLASRVLFKAKEKLRTFNCALPNAELKQLKHKRYAPNTGRKSRWGVTAYCEWKYKTIHDVSESNVETFILHSDLTRPKELKQDEFCSTMCKFVTEVHKHNGKDYPPNSLKGMVNAIQFYLH